MSRASAGSIRSCETWCSSLRMYARKQLRSRQWLTIRSSPASPSDCHTCSPRKPSKSSTRRARPRNAATSSSVRSGGTRSRETDTYDTAEGYGRLAAHGGGVKRSPTAAALWHEPPGPRPGGRGGHEETNCRPRHPSSAAASEQPAEDRDDQQDDQQPPQQVNREAHPEHDQRENQKHNE